MIKKIFNWSFGAFFRTIGRVLAYFLIGILILIIGSKIGLNLFLMPVKAASIPGWASNLPSLSRVDVWDCNSSNCNNSVSLGQQGLTTDYGLRDMLVTNSTVSIANNGIKMSYAYIQKSGYLYESIFYVCSSKDINSATFSVYGSDGSAAKNHSNTFNRTAILGMSNIPGNADQVMGSCRQIIGLFVPEKDMNWISAKITNSSTIKTSLEIIAVETRELGIYTDSIKSIIQDSGFATAKSVDEVKQATDKIEEETKKTNDTITDTSSPDTEDSINQWSEKMIDNPLEAVVMLPLNILNSIKTGLNGTCSPLNVPVPFIDVTIQIPCISSIFAQIEGVTEFWNSIGTIVSAIMLYQYLIYLYNWIDDTISLKTKRMQGWGSV